MTKYNESMNTDLDDIKTPADYDSNSSIWYINSRSSIIIRNGFSVDTLTVGTTALKVNDLANKRKMILKAEGDDAVYIGSDNTVTASSGYPILPGESISFYFDPLTNVDVYAIAASNQTLKVLETN